MLGPLLSLTLLAGPVALAQDPDPQVIQVRGDRVLIATAGAGWTPGVAVAVYPEQVWYSRVTVDDVEEIWSEHVLAGRIVERLRDELTPPE